MLLNLLWNNEKTNFCIPNSKSRKKSHLFQFFSVSKKTSFLCSSDFISLLLFGVYIFLISERVALGHQQYTSQQQSSLCSTYAKQMQEHELHLYKVPFDISWLEADPMLVIVRDGLVPFAFFAPASLKLTQVQGELVHLQRARDLLSWKHLAEWLN